METGARIQTLKQAFNAREGIPLKHSINKRALGIPAQKHGANKGRTIDLDRFIEDYWNAFGWNPNTGIPTNESLQKLELKDIVTCANSARR